MQNLLYFLFDKAYINITNICTNACRFCVRDIKEDVKGANLHLDNENVKAQDVIEQIEANKDKIAVHNEIIFCGYGEPLSKFEEVKKVLEYIRKNMPEVKTRINTNGHGNFLAKRNIAPELKPLVDSISISLNAQDEAAYNLISAPKIPNAYKEMIEFTKCCVKEGIDTTMSIVVNFDDKYKIDEEKCEETAKNLGAKFRKREWIKEGY